MKRCRAILVLLLSLWLPYSANAGLSQDLHCHHDGLGMLLDAPPHPHQAADPGCDCPIKCSCQHHCAAGAAAPLALATPGIHLPARMEAAAGPRPLHVATVYHASLLRPPTAPTGAA
jgi:hypothetical protein